MILAGAIALASPALPGPLGQPAGARQSAPACADLVSFENAQTLFESDPARWAALDTDRDGVACPDLPPGISPARWTDEVPFDADPATIRRVVDGDTIEVLVGGQVDTVRLILIDTPETRAPGEPVECFGPEATAFVERLFAEDADLYLETDVSERDRYDRLLRYAWLDFGNGFVVQVNEALVRSGHAILSTWPPDVAYVDEIRAAQQFAVEHDRGLWAACGGADVPLAGAGSTSSGQVGLAAPTAAPQPAPAPAPAAPAGGNCDPSYPTLCLPSYPDLDCGDVPATWFQVLQPDPHNFDGDLDGIGCEK